MEDFRDMLFNAAMKGDTSSFDKLSTDDKRDVIILLELNHNSLSIAYQHHLNNHKQHQIHDCVTN